MGKCSSLDRKPFVQLGENLNVHKLSIFSLQREKCCHIFLIKAKMPRYSFGKQHSKKEKKTHTFYQLQTKMTT